MIILRVKDVNRWTMPYYHKNGLIGSRYCRATFSVLLFGMGVLWGEQAANPSKAAELQG